MIYKCQKCKKECTQIYSDETKKMWICEKCWEEENKEDDNDE